jgi:hypothetical protein
MLPLSKIWPRRGEVSEADSPLGAIKRLEVQGVELEIVLLGLSAALVIGQGFLIL